MAESWSEVVFDIAILRQPNYLLQEAMVKQLDKLIV